jgi:hypothetical protein
LNLSYRLGWKGWNEFIFLWAVVSTVTNSWCL